MYTIKLIDWNETQGPARVIGELTDLLKQDGRFEATLEQGGRKMDEIHVRRVRLTKAKPYCGQHPGECAVGGPRRKGKWLEWEDWVVFNGLVNDALDKHKVNADVWSTPAEKLDKGRKMWIRRGTQRRFRYGWEETRPGLLGGPPLRTWNHGTEDQFEEE